VLGLGCWPIGGEMYAADGQSLGYSNASDKESVRALQAAVANGINLFDTAAAYGAGHSERLLGKAFKNTSEVLIATKIGIAIDESSKKLLGDQVEPDSIVPAIDRCLARLERDCIDLMLLHHNSLSPDKAEAVFDQMEMARELGKIRAYGWSTDYTASAKAMADRPGFAAVEHAMHVLMDAPNMQQVINETQLHALIRSPLAMGLLSGKYTAESVLPDNDIRATNQGWLKYYVDGKPNAEYINRFNAVRELLQTGGRTAAQGALAWLWAKSSRKTISRQPMMMSGLT